MSEPTSDSTPETPEPPHSPDGWELACLGIVRSQFGRRPSRALSKAIMQLSAEKAWVEARTEVTRMSWRKWLRGTFFAHPGFGLTLGVALVLILATLVWHFFPTSHGQTATIAVRSPNCRIVDTVNARWSGNAAPLKTGDRLPSGQLRLESGVVEIAFGSGAKAAVEGPAEFRLTEANSIELGQGKLSADVPQPAIGFTVRTPNATVIDLGTRFGVNAKTQNSSEVDVFEGKVHVTQGLDAKEPDNEWDLTRNMAMVLDGRGGVTAAAAPEMAFPQLSRAFMIRPANGGFEVSGFTGLGGVPSVFGLWSGPAFAVTGEIAGVRPAQGGGMLRFLAQSRPGALDSVVYQVIDLRPARAFVTTYGVVDLKVWGQFNRVPGDSHSCSKFNLTIAAFRGQPADAATLWAARSQTALAIGQKELVADNDPRTWERIEAATTVNADADFAVVEIRAVAPKDMPVTANPFPGHFVDLIDAKVCVNLRASSPAIPR